MLSVNKEDTTSVFNKFSQDEIDYFEQNYILVEDDDVLVEMLHSSSMARLHSKKSLVLTIAPTQTCNFGCTYCFEKYRKSTPMTDETENSIIEYIIHQRDYEGLEEIMLTWYGGEPLIEYQRVLSLAQKIKDLNIELGENTLITNGYFFTLDKIENLANVGIKSVQITLDGTKETHDIRRPLLNGNGTFDKIILNLDEYYKSEYRNSFEIALRVNIDKRNYAAFIDIHKWLNDRYKSDKLFVYPGIIVLDSDDENAKTCLSRHQVTDMFLDIYENYGFRFEELYPDDVNIECMTRSPHSMLIGSNGEIYKCYEELGEAKYVVGNINNKYVWTDLKRISQYTTGIDHYKDPKCRKCSCLPICRGGCPIRRLENVYMGKSNDCCTPFKDRISAYIKLHFEG